MKKILVLLLFISFFNNSDINSSNFHILRNPKVIKTVIVAGAIGTGIIGLVAWKHMKEKEQKEQEAHLLSPRDMKILESIDTIAPGLIILGGGTAFIMTKASFFEVLGGMVVALLTYKAGGRRIIIGILGIKNATNETPHYGTIDNGSSTAI